MRNDGLCPPARCAKASSQIRPATTRISWAVGEQEASIHAVSAGYGYSGMHTPCGESNSVICGWHERTLHATDRERRVLSETAVLPLPQEWPKSPKAGRSLRLTRLRNNGPVLEGVSRPVTAFLLSTTSCSILRIRLPASALATSQQEHGCRSPSRREGKLR